MLTRIAGAAAFAMSLLAELLGMSLITSAGAADLPVYAVEKWCDAVARSGGSKSEVIYGGCIKQEQSAYDHLKGSWDSLPEQTRSWCDQVAKSGGLGSYMILDGCVKQETTAAKENSRREFKR